jgi:hypothetical protein
MPVHLDRQHGAFHGTNPGFAGTIRRPALHRCLSLRTTEKTIMISRTDGGANETEAALSRVVDFR